MRQPGHNGVVMAEIAGQLDDHDVRVGIALGNKELERIIRRPVDNKDQLEIIDFETINRPQTLVDEGVQERAGFVDRGNDAKFAHMFARLCAVAA